MQWRDFFGWPQFLNSTFDILTSRPESYCPIKVRWIPYSVESELESPWNLMFLERDAISAPMKTSSVFVLSNELVWSYLKSYVVCKSNNEEVALT